MQDLKASIQDIQSAEDLSTILRIVEQLSDELKIGGDVGMSAEAVEELTAAARARCQELQSRSDKALADSERRLSQMQRAASLDISVITVDFLRESDGQVAWTRDDYLSMRGIDSDVRRRAFLDRVAEVKAQARAEGVTFTA